MRLTAWVVCVLACVILAIGVRLIVAEERDLRAAVVNEMLLFTRSVALAFENAIRDRQLDDVQQTLNELEAIDPRLDIYVIGPSAHVVARSTGAERPPTLPPDGQVHFLQRGAAEIAATHVELRGPMRRITGLVVARPLDDMAEDLARTRSQVWLTVICAIAATAILLLTLSRRFVAEPLEAMVEAMRGFRHGSSVQLKGPFRDDEVGRALKEFGELVEELRNARVRIEQAELGRVAMERHLQKLDKLATVGQLSAGLAHEVGSPLQVLEGRLKSLMRDLHDNAKAQRVLGMALEQTQRITRVVSQLLRFARPAPSAVRLVDPTTAARAVLDFLELEAKKRNVRFDVVFERAPRRMLVDPDHISQVILNLVRNALEATPSGGSIQIRMEERQAGEGAQLLLSVRDTGRGVAAGQREHIFEPFFTTRSETGGTGLGLAVVRALAERYGGQATLARDSGDGACFEVLMPLNTTSTQQGDPRADEIEIYPDRR